jgi:translation elongation factor EF-4
MDPQPSELLDLAHIDHGKSTLADRSRTTGALRRELEAQHLDSMDLSGSGDHDRGARRAPELHGQGRQGHVLNLIDTPGPSTLR